MREDMGLPMMVATIPRWSSFSRPWLSGQMCVSIDSMCVSPEQTPNSASGCAASGSSAGAKYLRAARSALPLGLAHARIDLIGLSMTLRKAVTSAACRAAGLAPVGHRAVRGSGLRQGLWLRVRSSAWGLTQYSGTHGARGTCPGAPPGY